MYRRIEEDVWPTVGLPTPYTFRRVLQHARPSTDTGPLFLYHYSEKPPYLGAFYDTLGIRRTQSRLKPPGPQGVKTSQKRSTTQRLPTSRTANCNKHRHHTGLRGFKSPTCPLIATNVNFRNNSKRRGHSYVSRYFTVCFIHVLCKVSLVCMSVSKKQMQHLIRKCVPLYISNFAH